MSTTSARPPEVLQHAELVLDLGPACDEDEGTFDLAEQTSEHLELLLEQQPGVRGKQLRDADGRRVRAVRGAEGVVHEHVVAVGQPARGLRVVLRLARIEARVLEHSNALVREELVHPRSDRGNRERRVRALGPTEM